jgi:hypothetical protein
MLDDIKPAISKHPELLGPLAKSGAQKTEIGVIIHLSETCGEFESLNDVLEGTLPANWRLVGCPQCAGAQVNFLANLVGKWNRMESYLDQGSPWGGSVNRQTALDPVWLPLGRNIVEELLLDLNGKHLPKFPQRAAWVKGVKRYADNWAKTQLIGIEKAKRSEKDENILLPVGTLRYKAFTDWHLLRPVKWINLKEAGYDLVVIQGSKKALDDLLDDGRNTRRFGGATPATRFKTLPKDDREWEVVLAVLEANPNTPIDELIQAIPDALIKH